MAKATWAEKLSRIAGRRLCRRESIFPAHAVKKEFLRPSKHTSECPWKGTAHYYNLEVDGMENETPPGITRTETSRRRNQGSRRLLERRPRRSVSNRNL